MTRSRTADPSAVGPAAAGVVAAVVAAVHSNVVAAAAAAAGTCGCGGQAASGGCLLALVAQILVRLVTRCGRCQQAFGSAQRGGWGGLGASSHRVRRILSHQHFVLEEKLEC